MDPLCEKYYEVSPYAYCAGNPVRFIDSDGKKLEFAAGVSENFKSQFNLTIKYLNVNGVGDLIKKIQDNKAVIYIKEGSDRSSFSPSTNTIQWDPNMGVITDLGVILSPAAVLNHEADHALQEITNPTQRQNDTNTPDAQYGNKEEKRVIEGSEQKTAKKLGEIKEGEVTRTDHDGQSIMTKGPTTTEEKTPIIIVAPKITKPLNSNPDENAN